jgi:hypothetical protein
MTEKLNQMDAVLSATLDVLDTSKNCHLALIFGDHGMTEDGWVLRGVSCDLVLGCLQSLVLTGPFSRGCVDRAGIMVEGQTMR